MSDALISRTTKSNSINIVQELGTSESSVMSQNASTNNLATKSHNHLLIHDFQMLGVAQESIFLVMMAVQSKSGLLEMVNT